MGTDVSTPFQPKDKLQRTVSWRRFFCAPKTRMRKYSHFSLNYFLLSAWFCRIIVRQKKSKIRLWFSAVWLPVFAGRMMMGGGIVPIEHTVKTLQTARISRMVWVLNGHWCNSMLCYVIIKYTFSLETTQLKLKLSKHAPSSFISCSELVRDCFQV